jgi:hypothetical protein
MLDAMRKFRHFASALCSDFIVIRTDWNARRMP